MKPLLFLERDVLSRILFACFSCVCLLSLVYFFCHVRNFPKQVQKAMRASGIEPDA